MAFLVRHWIVHHMIFFVCRPRVCATFGCHEAFLVSLLVAPGPRKTDALRHVVDKESKLTRSVARQHECAQFHRTRLPLIPYPTSVHVGLGSECLDIQSKNARVQLVNIEPNNPTVVAFMSSLRSASGSVNLIESKQSETAADSFHSSKIDTPDALERKPLIVQVALQQGDLPLESYELNVTANHIVLAAPNIAGLFYGVQTFRQLTDASETLPLVSIVDTPRFEWRGFALDVSRHFFNASRVKKLIDIMSQYKLNKFHWHLTDDHGWRFPVSGYSYLTQIGAESVDGHEDYYTREEISDVVRYAAERHIDIIPEFDSPGHAQAMVAAYNSIGNTDIPGWEPPLTPSRNEGLSISPYTLAPTNETDEVITAVVNTLADLFPSKVIHLGGDEVRTEQYNQSPRAEVVKRKHGEVQTYFNEKLVKQAQRVNRTPAFWDEAIEFGGIPQDAIIFCWRSWDALTQAIGKGNRVVNTNMNLYYFNYGQSDDDFQSGRGLTNPWLRSKGIDIRQVYEEDPVHANVAERADQMLGIEAQLWTEKLKTWDDVETMAFPRIFALAERAWSNYSTATLEDIDDFLQRLKLRFREEPDFKYSSAEVVA